MVGEGSGEEQLFSSESILMKDGLSGELDAYLQRIKVQIDVPPALSASILVPFLLALYKFDV